MRAANVHRLRPVRAAERAPPRQAPTEFAAASARPLAQAEGPLGAALAWHLAAPGKGMRRHLAGAAGRAFGLSGEVAAALADIVEAVHEASILLDDIADGEETRRGRPTCARRHGPHLATLAAVTLLARAQAGAAALASLEQRPGAAALASLEQRPGAAALAALERRPGALQAALADAIAQACEGQARDLVEEPLSWAQYETIARAKTGRLVALAIELPAIAAGLDEEEVAAAREAAMAIGLAYQIRDDLADGDLAEDGLVPSPAERLVALRAQVAQAIGRAPPALAPVLARLARQVDP